MTDLFYLSFKAIDVVSVACINDAPLVYDLEADGIVTTIPINYWLTSGKNKLSIRLAWPENKTFESGKAKIEAMVFRADLNLKSPQPGEIIHELKWPGDEMTDELEMYPRSFEENFYISDPPQTRLWKEAEKIEELTPKDKEKILKLIEKLRQDLLNKEKEDAFSLLAYRYQDEALAEGKSLAQIRSAVFELYDWMYSHGDLIAEPLKLANSRFTIVGKNKVVFADRDNYGMAVVLEEPEGSCFGIPIYVSRIQGNWMIVR